MKRVIPVGVVTAWLLCVAGDAADDARAIVDRHCRSCHAGDKPKGDLAVERLTVDFADEKNAERWSEIARRVKAGEMPPAGKPRLSDVEQRTLVEWIDAQNDSAARRRAAAEGRTTLRRLNRLEYERTIRDLLAIEVDLKDLLPIDSSADGFDNSGAALHTSSFLMEKYLDAADLALNLAIANLPQPPLVKKRIDFKEERQVKIATESVFRKTDDALVMFSSSLWNAITVGQFYPPDRGRYRIRVHAYGFQSDSKPVTVRIDAGPMLMGQKNHLVGYFDFPSNQPTVVEWTEHLEARHSIRVLPHGLATAQAVNKIGADVYTGAGLAVQAVEVEGPLHEVWPPESHRRLFGDLPQKNLREFNNRARVEVMSEKPREDADAILRRFARRAFRRPVDDADIEPLLKLVDARLSEGDTFEQAVRVGLKAVLVSPKFLFLDEKPGRLDQFALASRLSYFLWSTMPDEELSQLAEQGRLDDATIWRQQVERLLQSPRSATFVENFVSQWLGLRDIDFTVPDHLLYPDYDELLREGMMQETLQFFGEVLKDDLSVSNFVASDFSVLNERLARHYGIPGVEGLKFRRVALPPDSHRGGVMTMASVLKVTANGTTTSPVVRGAWVLDRILGTPPSPPPAGVPAIEPDIRGATTVREQLAKHRQIESCATCHTRIDPPGFALESFDVIGGWRDNYRTRGRGEPVTIDGRRMHYLKGPKVDPADRLADGRSFANIDELKRLLLADRDQIARALAVRLVSYATGQAPRSQDRAELDALLAATRTRDHGLRTMVHEITTSPLFRNK
ncbi:MAG TPA: DUF1592 domain-containing protein [Pirellulaceae bacterium]|nr:DUF1592 domain-containing protein [Pirellulaceae bacterium]